MEHIRESAAKVVGLSAFPFGAACLDHRGTRQRAAGFDVDSTEKRVSQLRIIHQSLLVISVGGRGPITTAIRGFVPCGSPAGGART